MHFWLYSIASLIWSLTSSNSNIFARGGYFSPMIILNEKTFAAKEMEDQTNVAYLPVGTQSPPEKQVIGVNWQHGDSNIKMISHLW